MGIHSPSIEDEQRGKLSRMFGTPDQTNVNREMVLLSVWTKRSGGWRSLCYFAILDANHESLVPPCPSDRVLEP